ncbi:MAG: helix-turn-helix domain-containing protein [Ruminococcaceae bacterium]|nr:helix-turn-helix domain-containing protein [Oscillospiraceae bacterium]
MKKYFNYQVHKDVTVRNLITIETLDLSDRFRYPEESHEFYEFAYVDSGAIFCDMGAESTLLQQGELLLIPPQCTHSYRTARSQSAAIFILCFRSQSEYLSILDQKIKLDKEAKHMISEIIRESKNAFVFPFDKKLKPLPTGLFGAQQMVENRIETLLIHLIRAQISQNRDIVFVMNSVELEHSLCNDITKLLKEHVYSSITLDEISRQTFYSKTFLNGVFKKNTGLPIMKYYTMLKVQEAKKLLRKNTPISSVAAQLNFDSATYFTKVFKKYAKMTPSAYKKTIF